MKKKVCIGNILIALFNIIFILSWPAMMLTRFGDIKLYYLSITAMIVSAIMIGLLYYIKEQ